MSYVCRSHCVAQRNARACAHDANYCTLLWLWNSRGPIYPRRAIAEYESARASIKLRYVVVRGRTLFYLSRSR